MRGAFLYQANLFESYLMPSFDQFPLYPCRPSTFLLPLRPRPRPLICAGLDHLDIEQVKLLACENSFRLLRRPWRGGYSPPALEVNILDRLRAPHQLEIHHEVRGLDLDRRDAVELQVQLCHSHRQPSNVTTRKLDVAQVN